MRETDGMENRVACDVGMTGRWRSLDGGRAAKAA